MPKDKTVVRPSNLYNGGAYTGKTTDLYWDSPQTRMCYIQSESNDNTIWLICGYDKCQPRSLFHVTNGFAY